jgi:hypothetical protein
VTPFPNWHYYTDNVLTDRLLAHGKQLCFDERYVFSHEPDPIGRLDGPDGCLAEDHAAYMREPR